jgi:restriction system protein
MPEITRKRVGELVRGVFAILEANPDGLAAKEVLAELAKRVPPTPFENSAYPDNPDVRRYEKIVRFSTITAVKAGWLVKDKGHWYATEEGIRAYRRISDPAQFVREASRLYKEWKKGQPNVEIVEAPEVPPDLSTVLEEAEEMAWLEIAEHLAAMTHTSFRSWSQDLFVGWDITFPGWRLPVRIRGIDIIAHTDPLGITGPKVKIQVKRQQTPVSPDGLRAFMAVLAPFRCGTFCLHRRVYTGRATGGTK